MKLKFWGVRGSIPSPGKDTSVYGGNTSCYELIDEEGRCLIFDAGTGIRELGMDLAKRGVKDINLFITHTHWDHIQGFPFFTPAYIPGTTINLYGPKHFEKTLMSIMNLQMDYAYFPISMQQLNAEINYFDLTEQTLELGDTKVETKLSNHPVTGLCYKVTSKGKTFVYSGDMELYYNVLKQGRADGAEENVDDFEDDFEGDEDMDELVVERNKHHKDFCSSDLLVHDAQYTAEEYPKFQGWGHSCMEDIIEMGKTGSVKKLVLTHHDPARLDATLSEIEKKLQADNPDYDLCFSREGTEIEF